MTAALPIPSPPRACARVRVLVVDESAAQRYLLSVVLREMGFAVEAVANPQAALDLCRAPEGDDVRMVLSGWHMSGMSGPAFCRAFRALPRTHYAYFILITASDIPGAKALGLTAGADDFLARPVDLDELRARVGAACRMLDMQEKLLHRNHEVATTLADLQSIHDGITRDLAEARKLQRGFLPARRRTTPCGRLGLRLLTCGQVGGDLVGWVPIDATRTALYSIDVAGHGIASALLTGRLAGMFAGMRPRDSIIFDDDPLEPDPPDRVLARVNDFMLGQMGSDIYFTAVLAYVDEARGMVRFAQAGHPHPVLRHADGTIAWLGDGGPPVGLLPDAEYDSVAVRLHPGDALLLHSDGLTECADTWGDMIGEAGLARLLRDAPVEGADGVDATIERIETGLVDHAGIVGLQDDVSMLLYRWDGPAAAADG